MSGDHRHASQWTHPVDSGGGDQRVSTWAISGGSDDHLADLLALLDRRRDRLS